MAIVSEELESKPDQPIFNEPMLFRPGLKQGDRSGNTDPSLRSDSYSSVGARMSRRGGIKTALIRGLPRQGIITSMAGEFHKLRSDVGIDPAADDITAT